MQPLVDPKPLSPEEKKRYARHYTLPGIGIEGQERFNAARVLSIGAGGLGSPVLMYLAAAGIGTLAIIDNDTVDTSNLQRQIIHSDASVGVSKTASAAATLRSQNPYVEVIEHNELLTAENALEIFADYDLIIDGSDNFATRYIVNDACEQLSKPLIWGTISQYTAQVSVFWGSISQDDGTEVPGPTLRDLYPDIPPADSVPTCAAGGVLGSLCGVVGSVMATEALKLIAGVSDCLIGKLWMYDARTQTVRTLKFTRDPQRTAVQLSDTQAEIQAANMSQTEETIPEITLDEYKQRQSDFIALDVREPAERELGHYQDAGNLPHAVLIQTIEAATGLDDLPSVLATHVDANLLIYCAGGIRSAKVVRALAKNFPEIKAFSLAGGYQEF